MARMNRLSGTTMVLGTLLFSLCLPLAANAGEAKWVLLDSDPGSSEFFYDKGGVAESMPDTLSIRAKVVYTPEGKADALKLLQDAKTYAGLASTEYRYEIMCGDMRQSRLNYVGHFDITGKLIVEFKLAGKTQWEEIPRDSRLDAVADEECKQLNPAGK